MIKSKIEKILCDDTLSYSCFFTTQL
ncbi:MAG TPA: hypothetical protein DDX93_04380 [Smithella sp.]|nr:hypothetical protein [Smithella sp.]